MVASMDRVLDPKSGSGALAALAGILSPGGTEATDTYTVDIQPRQAVRRLPVHGVPVVVQHGHPAAQLQGRLHRQPRRHRTLHGQGVRRQAEVRDGQEPTYWGKDASGNKLPYLDGVNWTMIQDESAANLQLQSGTIDFQPQTVFQGSQALFADPNLRVDVYPRHRYPRGRVQHAEGAVEERPEGAPPGRRLLPRTRGPQQGAVRRPLHCRQRQLLGAGGLPDQPDPEPRALRTTTRPSSCSPTPGRRTASTSS